MRFFDRFRNRVKIPPFGVGIYGKLPGYKDFLFASCSPAFSDWKIFLDRGFDSLIRGGMPNPYVSPARRFFVEMKDQKVGLVGCIWDSSDGLRYFPFMTAMTLPRRYCQAAFPEFWQTLEQIWCYLEDLKQELEAYDSSTGILKHVRGEDHKIESFEPIKWEVKDHPLAHKARSEFERGMLSRLDLSSISALEELEVIHGLCLKRNPSFILWPITRWRDEHRGTTLAYLGSKGMGDLNIRFFPPVKDDPLLAKKGPTPNLDGPGGEQPSVTDSGSIVSPLPRIRKPEPVPGLSEDHPMHPSNQQRETTEAVAEQRDEDDEADTLRVRRDALADDEEDTRTEPIPIPDAGPNENGNHDQTGGVSESAPMPPPAEPPRREPPPRAARRMPEPQPMPGAANEAAASESRLPPPAEPPPPAAPPSAAEPAQPLMVLGQSPRPATPAGRDDDMDSTMPLDTIYNEGKSEPLPVEEEPDGEPLREYSDWEVEEAQAELEAAKSRKIPELHDDDIFDPNDSAGPLDLEGLGLKDPPS